MKEAVKPRYNTVIPFILSSTSSKTTLGQE
jgi:hypothetical protein